MRLRRLALSVGDLVQNNAMHSALIDDHLHLRECVEPQVQVWHCFDAKAKFGEFPKLSKKSSRRGYMTKTVDLEKLKLS
jgi:hypothetical protein